MYFAIVEQAIEDLSLREPVRQYRKLSDREEVMYQLKVTNYRCNKASAVSYLTGYLLDDHCTLLGVSSVWIRDIIKKLGLPMPLVSQI